MFMKKLFKATNFTGKTLDELYKEKRFSQEQINVLTEFIGLIKELNVSSKDAPNCYADDKTGEIYCAQYISINKKSYLISCRKYEGESSYWLIVPDFITGLYFKKDKNELIDAINKLKGEKLIIKSTKEIFENLKSYIPKSELNNNDVLEIENDLKVLNILRKILYIDVDVENGIMVLNNNTTYRTEISRYIGKDYAEIVKNWLNRKPDDEYKDFYGSLNNINKKGEK